MQRSCLLVEGDTVVLQVKVALKSDNDQAGMQGSREGESKEEHNTAMRS